MSEELEELQIDFSEHGRAADCKLSIEQQKKQQQKKQKEHGRDARVTHGRDAHATKNGHATEDDNSQAVEAIVGRCPRNKVELAAFVKNFCGMDVPDRAVCPNHSSPMDYLSRSFLAQDDLLVWANRGGGKTMLAAVATLLDGLFHRPAKIRVLGGSFDQSDRLADYVRDMLLERPELLAGRNTRTRVKLLGGSEIRMLAQSQRAVRGQHVQKIRCDEVDLFDPEVWKAVQFATRSADTTRGSIEVLSTLHRSGGLMDQLVRAARAAESSDDLAAPRAAGYRMVCWCLWEVIERCPPERSCAACPLEEDCRGVARDACGYFRIDDAIAIKARSSRAAWEAEMLCRGPARAEHLVFGEFSPGRHVAPVAYCADWPLYRAIDFGYRDPLVCLWIQITPSGRVHVLDEYIRTQLPVAQHSLAIKDHDLALTGKVGAAATYVDPAGRHREGATGSACTELLAENGIVCTSRGSAIADGLELIRAALSPAIMPPDGLPMLIVHPRCTGLIDSFNQYHFGPPGSGDADAPVKDGPDHALDALRYFFINKMRPQMATVRGRY